ncbi:Phenylacetic acid degradation protein PaaD, thioesterase [hydrothermal vent metagenome]|uniref:Phenylacetic acid degradation protein PaaD, thioesterase n=1 Tax=hydrothermal vent metagenome TaxID=652676 RepID=A0A3B1B6D8_9ZZZZ
MSHKEQEQADKIAAIFNSRRTLDKLLNIEFISIGAGTAIMRMKLTEDMVNVYGSAHGGAIFALADAVFAYACNSQNIITVAAGCSIEYLAPSFPGDILKASANFQGGRGKQGIYDIMITNQNDQLIATFRGKSHSTKEKILGDNT